MQRSGEGARSVGGADGAASRRPRTPARRSRARHRTAALRGGYFAHAAESAGRYGVAFEDVLRHLWHARRIVGRIDLESVRHLDDLVHVIACRVNLGLAWSDLVERYEPMLVRRNTARVGQMRAILTVRRTFSRLRHGNSHFAAYVGDRPLRIWLTDRVISESGYYDRRGATIIDATPDVRALSWPPAAPCAEARSVETVGRLPFGPIELS